MSVCPECKTHIRVTEEVKVGNIILCPNCQISLEVVCREPVEMTLVPDLVEGDWAD